MIITYLLVGYQIVRGKNKIKMGNKIIIIFICRFIFSIWKQSNQKGRASFFWQLRVKKQSHSPNASTPGRNIRTYQWIWRRKWSSKRRRKTNPSQQSRSFYFILYKFFCFKFYRLFFLFLESNLLYKKKEKKCPLYIYIFFFLAK